MILKSEIYNFHRLDLTRQAGFIVTIYDEDRLRLAATMPFLTLCPRLRGSAKDRALIGLLGKVTIDRMTHYPTLTQQAVFAAKIGSLLAAAAKRIVTLPKDQREAGLTIVCRTYATELKENGLDNEHGRKWLDLQIEVIRLLIAEIETSGVR